MLSFWTLNSRNYQLNLFAAILLLSLLAPSCKKSKQQDETIKPPVASLLISPLNNELCESGTPISQNQSRVRFRWNAAEHTESYELVVEELYSKIITRQSTTANELELVLARNTAYGWYVVSKSSKTNQVSNSPGRNFYNAGIGVLSYAPFPAELTAPFFAQRIARNTRSLELSWKAGDVDNDIVSYDIYFGKQSTPALYKSGVLTKSLPSVPVEGPSVFFWKVVTKDAKGNRSESDIFQFEII